MPTQAIIFDCDGVLIDSEAICIREERAALSVLGCEIEPERYAAHFVGLSDQAANTILMEEFGVVLPADFWPQLEATVFDMFRRELRAMPGCEQLLEGLTWPCCVASSSSTDRLAYTLCLTGLQPYFDGRVFSARMVARGKPHPDLFLFAAERLGARPQDCVVVEDSPHGVQAAHAAGMRVIGFTGGAHMTPSTRDRLLQARPHTMVESMEQLGLVLGGVC
jgi:HAD superfamily hydrolase (TIGR01509 family)